jgi:hypothetical protein
MRKSKHHEYRQAYNAQAIVCAEGAQLILATEVAVTPSDQPTFLATIRAIPAQIGLPTTILADAGYASGPAGAAIKAMQIEPLVAIARTQPQRPYDFRPPPDPKPTRAITEPWRIDMQATLETEDAKNKYKLRKQTVEPVFGIIKSVLGFQRFSLRRLQKVKTEWTLLALAYNCKRMRTLRAA